MYGILVSMLYNVMSYGSMYGILVSMVYNVMTWLYEYEQYLMLW